MQTNSFIYHLLSNVTLDPQRVIELVNSVSDGNTDKIMHIMSYLTGYSNYPEVPETSVIHEAATLVSYDFFKNEVSYKYLNSHKVKVSEELKDFDGSIYDDWYDVPRELRNNSGEFEITVKYYSSNTCSLERWLKYN